MRWGKNGEYDTYSEFISSKEGEESIISFQKSLLLNEINKRNNIVRVKRFFHSDYKDIGESQKLFNSLMDRIEARHDDRWDNVCYRNGIEPYPWQILNTIFELSESEGIPYYGYLDSFTKTFPTHIMEYMGWQFATTYGQGAMQSIYKNKILKFRI